MYCKYCGRSITIDSTFAHIVANFWVNPKLGQIRTFSRVIEA